MEGHARHRDSNVVSAWPGEIALFLKAVCSSNTDHHFMRSPGGGNNAWILMDFTAVYGHKLDLSLEVPGCSQRIGDLPFSQTRPGPPPPSHLAQDIHGSPQPS